MQYRTSNVKLNPYQNPFKVFKLRNMSPRNDIVRDRAQVKKTVFEWWSDVPWIQPCSGREPTGLRHPSRQMLAHLVKDLDGDHFRESSFLERHG